ncbi:FGGY family carbohydrate kinase [Rhodococcus sp. NCIMB 12038]|uniref:FGGY family carbohydrate kinase n=1 Tax=Rhodococcus sp. NCIMB 12038 TaxID=933800 RepID=UPI000B3BE9A0|nr:FGGY family carbohydrate kinase [Rhodococcus sp. NCIMB 12038]OUS88545.1 hypothetical protein CA951_37895 [Rhodococcus sp. NCIMB 12038]
MKTWNDPAVLAIDQGTSATKALLVDRDGHVISRHSVAIGQSHPRPGWVEQDANAVLESVRTCFDISGIDLGEPPVLAISNQRESAVIWDRRTGEPLGPMLGWQDRRTLPDARRLHQDGVTALVRQLSGLPLDPMFSALKFAWLLDQIDPDRRRSRAGEICLGTVDAWLLFSLTGEHRIETGNASRTQLLNVATAEWDRELLALFNIPIQALPKVTPSNVPSKRFLAGPVGHTHIAGVLGDSHAALYAHEATHPGAVKVTYGTGSSIMGISGRPVEPESGLVRTIAWQDEKIGHAFEGNILSAGGTIVWLAKLLECFPEDISRLAQSVRTSDGVDLVPAFAGLGAPWWDEQAEAIVSGLCLGTSRAHLARAALESIVLQIEDVLTAADQVAIKPIDQIMVDGGPSKNDFLMQLQSDISRRRVVRAANTDLSAFGAARMAARAAGMPELITNTEEVTFESALPQEDATQRRVRWIDALSRSFLRPNQAPSGLSSHHPTVVDS